MRTRVLASLAAAALTTTLVTGCGNDASTPPMEGHSMGSASAESNSDATQFDNADVMFARMMYPHHAQAVEMAALVDGRTTDPDVIALAGEIAAAQQSEMDRFAAWLDDWGQPAPSADMNDMGGMDHGSGMGMMSAQEMEALMASSGAEFDRLWLTMMIEHHRGAIEMAQVEIADGIDPDAVELARSIVETQQQEIDTMERLLG